MANAAPKKEPSMGGPGLDELRYISQIYQNQYALITRELNTKMEIIKELDAAQRTLETMDQAKGKASLVPIGYEVYLNGQIAKSEKVLVGVGSGYLVEKSVDEAKQYVAKAVDLETKRLNELMRAKKEVEAALIEVSYKLEQAMHM